MKDWVANWKAYLQEHKKMHLIYENGLIFLMSTISALIFAFGFNVFMAPTLSGISPIASGGMSGVSQVLTAILRLCGWRDLDENIAHSLLYFLLNVPLMILAFLGIGKRFAIYTLINVIETSIFIRFITPIYIPLLKDVTDLVTAEGGYLSRVLFGGVCTGLSSAICFKFEISTGGIDIIAYYISLRKRTNVGKYSALCNGLSVTLFTLFSILDVVIYGTSGDMNIAIADPFVRLLFSVIYLFTCAMVIDAINIRNKKVRIEAVTSLRSLGTELVHNNHHGVTVVEAHGAYTGQVRYIVTMVVSAYEVKSIIRFIHQIDEHAFIQTQTINQVYGRFYMKPVE